MDRDDDDLEACEHQRQLELVRELELAMQNAMDGVATEDDWSLLCWQCGIADFWKRTSTKEKRHEMV